MCVLVAHFPNIKHFFKKEQIKEQFVRDSSKTQQSNLCSVRKGILFQPLEKKMQNSHTIYSCCPFTLL